MITRGTNKTLWEGELQNDVPVAKKIVHHRSSLADFSEWLGTEFYGARWLPNVVMSFGQKQPCLSTDQKAMQQDILDQVTLALRHGIIEAQFETSLPYPAWPKKNVKSNEYGSDDEIFDDVDVTLLIDKAFWVEDWKESITDWSRSIFEIKMSLLLTTSCNLFGVERGSTEPLLASKPHLSGVDPSALKGKLFIGKVDVAYDIVSGKLPLPTGVQRERYRGLNIRFRDELIAATWRQVAMHFIKSRYDDVAVGFMLGYMMEYMAEYGVSEEQEGLSKSTLEAICRRMHAQFQARDKTSMPFLNSTVPPKGLRQGRKRPK